MRICYSLFQKNVVRDGSNITKRVLKWKRKSQIPHLERGAGETMDKTYRGWLYQTVMETTLQVPQPVTFEMITELLPIIQLTKEEYEKSLVSKEI